MPLLPISHFEWQVLRTIKRSKHPPVGRALRLAPTRRTKDGTFLTDLVEKGLVARVSGTAQAPFEATYALTEMGEHAAEYGECDFPLRAITGTPATPTPRAKSRGGRKSR